MPQQRNRRVVIERRPVEPASEVATMIGELIGGPPKSISLVDAQRQVGVSLLAVRGLPGVNLDSVTYHGPLTDRNGSVVLNAGGSVELRYAVPGGVPADRVISAARR
jgi:hypothetical protein